MVFFLFQGGRILLYIECRLTGSITTPSCDCVKILADAKPGPETIPNGNHSSHKHLTEEFELLTTAFNDNIVLLSSPGHVACAASIPAGVSQDVFHPPIA